MIIPDWMSLLRGFWNTNNEQAFMDVRVLILWLRAILINHNPAATERMRRNEHMKSMSGMSNMVLLHL